MSIAACSFCHQRTVRASAKELASSEAAWSPAPSVLIIMDGKTSATMRRRQEAGFWSVPTTRLTSATPPGQS